MMTTPDNSQRDIHSGGGVMITGKDGMRMFQAFTLASAIRLYEKTGVMPNRHVTITGMMKLATEFTGKKYKRGAYEAAAADVQKWAEEMRSAIPTTLDGEQVL